MDTLSTVRATPSTPLNAPQQGAALQRTLLSAARQEADAEVSQILMALARLVDRRTPDRMRSSVVAEVVNTVSTLACRDELTGVLNRRGFLRQGAALLRRAVASGHRATLFYADVNGLKRINDTAGHLAGDALLVRAGAVLGAAFRRGDVLGRLGGDEFAGLALSADVGSDRWMRRRLGQALHRANAEPGHPAVSLSVGIASSTPALPLSLEELIEQADRAMYACKQRPSASQPGPAWPRAT